MSILTGLKGKLVSLQKHIKTYIQKIPEFSDKNYVIACYVCAGLLTIAGGLLIYAVISHSSSLTFSANWNIFTSPFGNFCFFIGFICAIVFWGKFGHYSMKPIIEKRDHNGNLIERKENMDIIEQMFAKVVIPLFGHFILEPIIYGSIIYYPIQVIIAIIGSVFPYVLSLIILAIAVGSWISTKKFQFRYRSLLLVVITLIFTAAFGIGSYAILSPASHIGSDYVENTPASTNNNPDQQDESLFASEDSTIQQTASEEQVSTQEQSQESEEQEDGLFSAVPNGTTKYAGDMAGFPIEFSIVKNQETSTLYATYKNVKYGTTMKMEGEALPANGNDLTFYGKDQGNDWVFSLTGDVDNITGTANSGGKSLKVTLHRVQ